MKHITNKEFNATWIALAHFGKCDDIDGAEYTRVFRELENDDSIQNIDNLVDRIVEAANRQPETIVPDRVIMSVTVNTDDPIMTNDPAGHLSCVLENFADEISSGATAGEVCRNDTGEIVGEYRVYLLTDGEAICPDCGEPMTDDDESTPHIH